MFGNTFKILCSFSWIQGPAPEDVKPPLPMKSFSTPTNQDQSLQWTLYPDWYRSVAKSYLTLCDYLFGNKTAFPVFHYFV